MNSEPSYDTQKCLSGGLSSLTVAVISGFGGFIVSVLLSSVVWWRVLRRSKNARKISGKGKSDKEQSYDDVRADTQDLQPAYEVVTRAASQEEFARRGIEQEPSYEPTYVDAQGKQSEYDVVKMDTIESDEPATTRKNEPTYEATYVDGRGLQSGYDVINQETVDDYGQVVSHRPTTTNAAYETIG